MNRLFITLIVIFYCGLTTLNAQNFSTHQVKKGETLTAVAKHYAVAKADILSLNPDAKEALQPNTILIIPISKSTQPKPVDRKVLDGFKTHKTKKKETLYSLTKRYGVTEAEIKKHNKFLYSNPLRKGDKLQIPVYKVTEIPVAEEKTDTKAYIVKPKEGKWRIAYKYGITVEALEALNPDMGDVLQDGQILNVPNIDTAEEKTVDEEKYSYYQVLPKEGFYRLKVKLNLEQEVLEILNPELKEGGLKAGMILKVPFSEALAAKTGPLAPVNLAKQIRNFEQKHIVLMLPFRLNKVEFDSVAEIKKRISKDPYLDVSLDFYSGVLTAVDSLKQMGMSLKLDVYDTKNETTAVTRLVTETNFDSVDAVLGPLTTKNFNAVATALQPYHIPVVSPVGTNLKLQDNVFQSRPSDALLKEKIIQFVKNDTLPKHILIIADSKNKKVAEDLKQAFGTASVIYSRKNKEGKDENYVMVGDIKSGLKPGRNIVFLETQNEGFASNVTSVLASLMQNKTIETKQDIKITLATTRYNRAFQGDEINNTHLSKLQLHFATASKNYPDERDNAFVNAYDEKYNITPSKAAVKGFDLMMDVALRLAASDNLYTSVNTAPLTAYIENKFAYKKDLLGGFYNDAVYLLKYDNLNIVPVE